MWDLSALTRDRTRVSCIGRRILNHWTTREVPNLDFFISFSYLIGVARASNTMFNESRESGHPCLVPDFKRNYFSFSPLSMMLIVGLSYIAFIIVEIGSLFTYFVGSFCHKWMLNFVKSCFASFEMDI